MGPWVMGFLGRPWRNSQVLYSKYYLEWNTWEKLGYLGYLGSMGLMGFLGAWDLGIHGINGGSWGGLTVAGSGAKNGQNGVGASFYVQLDV